MKLFSNWITTTNQKVKSAKSRSRTTQSFWCALMARSSNTKPKTRFRHISTRTSTIKSRILSHPPSTWSSVTRSQWRLASQLYIWTIRMTKVSSELRTVIFTTSIWLIRLSWTQIRNSKPPKSDLLPEWLPVLKSCRPWEVTHRTLKSFTRHVESTRMIFVFTPQTRWIKSLIGQLSRRVLFASCWAAMASRLHSALKSTGSSAMLTAWSDSCSSTN